jgi:hypothetical protein
MDTKTVDDVMPKALVDYVMELGDLDWGHHHGGWWICGYTDAARGDKRLVIWDEAEGEELSDEVCD